MTVLNNGLRNAKNINIPICLGVAFCVAFLVVLSLFVPIVALVAFFVSILYVTCSNDKSIFAFLFFLFPFALVFKMSPDSSSLFTFVELFSVAIIFLKKRAISIRVMVVFIPLLALVTLTMNSILEVLKLFLIFVLYYLFTTVYDSKDTEKYLLFFVCGLLSSTVLGIFKEKIPRLLSFYSDLNYDWLNGKYTIRFSGIYNDPNYFSIALVQPLILFALFIIGKKTKHKLLMIFSGLALIGFGMSTYSKSFYLILGIIFILIMLSDIRKNLVFLVLSALGVVLLIIWNPRGIFDGIIYRFLSGDITTGRVAIWIEYWKVISSSWRNILIGVGLGAPYVQKAAHNLYVETVYYIGFIGLILYTVVMFTVSTNRKSQFKKSVLNYIGYICLALQYAFLCGVTGYDVPFYLMMSYMIYNNDWKSAAKERELLK